MSAPEHARPLTEEAPGWANLEAGIWFVCGCGRIGHISELLFTENRTKMWCPRCKEDDWSWANNDTVEKAKNRHHR